MTIQPEPRTKVRDDSDVRPELRLMTVTCNRLRANREDPSRPHAGWLAAVRAGLVSATDTQALPATVAYIQHLQGEQQRVGARRAAAIRAVQKPTKDFEPTETEKWRALGKSFSLLYRAEYGRYPRDDSHEAMAAQINALPLMDVESAAVVLNQLIGRCAGHGISVDFRDLSATLVFWGNGISPASRRTRDRVVLVFYGSNDR